MQSEFEMYREIIKDNNSYDILMQEMKFDADSWPRSLTSWYSLREIEEPYANHAYGPGTFK